MSWKNRAAAATAATAIMFGAAACASDAEVASENVSEAADNFEVQRRIVMFNGITDKYLMEIVGACSIDDDGSQLEVICKVSKDKYKKHFLHLSDNVSYFVEQGEPVKVSSMHYRVTFKPQTIIPDPDFRGSSEDLPASQ